VVITERTRVPPRYRLLEEVGQGGMAIVYRAVDDSLKREVAVKVLHPHLSAEPESKARLEREAQAVAKLKHDNILEIFDYSGSDAGSAYIVTEFIDGLTLKQFLADRKITHPEVAALVAVELGNALAHAHGLGIIHRDIKPENVMIRKDGLLKLMDFGIAQVLDLERMTVTGQLLGSPAYMAPELIEGRPLDVRTDVFSLGVLMYQIATGSLPFSGKNPHEVLRRITDGRFVDARSINRLCSAGLSRILARALARDPADRYPQMQVLVDDLREHLSESGVVDVREELRSYFSNPEAYEAALPGRMTPALTASAQRHLAAKASGPAIECWNRVLAYAPDDAAVLAALKRLEGRGRRRMMGVYVLGGLVAVGLLAGLVAALVHGDSRPVMGVPVPFPADPDLHAGTRPDPSAGPASRGARSAADLHSSVPAGAAVPKSAAARPARSRSSAGETDRPSKGDMPASDDKQGGGPEESPSGASLAIRTFTLGPTPQNVDIYLDGERQFSYDTDHRSLSVPWAKNHVIEFRSPSGCCFVERVEVGPDQPLPPDNIIARKLKWKPARLVITTVPAADGTRVMVRDPSHPGRGTVVGPGEEANIPFFASDEGQKEIEVSIDSAAGFAADRVTVRAGERKAVVVTLGAAAP
jgi:tRNA A-37 threonylcarbamoyl transferase component Bud32